MQATGSAVKCTALANCAGPTEESTTATCVRTCSTAMVYWKHPVPAVPATKATGRTAKCPDTAPSSKKEKWFLFSERVLSVTARIMTKSDTRLDNVLQVRKWGRVRRFLPGQSTPRPWDAEARSLPHIGRRRLRRPVGLGSETRIRRYGRHCCRFVITFEKPTKQTIRFTYIYLY